MSEATALPTEPRPLSPQAAFLFVHFPNPNLVWPDVSKSFLDNIHNNFYINWSISTQPKNYQSFWATFYKQICWQELSKITQSGHTDPNYKICLNLPTKAPKLWIEAEILNLNPKQVILTRKKKWSFDNDKFNQGTISLLNKLFVSNFLIK